MSLTQIFFQILLNAKLCTFYFVSYIVAIFIFVLHVKSPLIFRNNVFFMVCLLLANFTEFVEYYTLDKDARQESTKLYNMQIALTNELVSMLVNYYFLHHIFLQGGLFGILVSNWCQPYVGMYGARGIAIGLHLCDLTCFFSSLLHELQIILNIKGAPMHVIW